MEHIVTDSGIICNKQKKFFEVSYPAGDACPGCHAMIKDKGAYRMANGHILTEGCMICPRDGLNEYKYIEISHPGGEICPKSLGGCGKVLLKEASAI